MTSEYTRIDDFPLVTARRTELASPRQLPQRSSAKKLRRWTINGAFVMKKATGVSRYAWEMTRAIDQLIRERDPLTADLDLQLLVPGSPIEPMILSHIPIVHVPEFRWPRLPQFWSQVQLPHHARGGLLSFCNLAPISYQKQIVCIHDLHTRLVPDSYSRMFRWAHRVVLPILGRRATMLTTVSELSRSQLVAHGIAGPERIVVAYNGSDHARRWDLGKAESCSRQRPYIFCLGQPQAYKNMDLIGKIANRVDKLGLDIVIAGELSESLRRRVGNNVSVVGRVDDAHLAHLYRNAVCFVFPSRMEGFGLPVVEAMTLGCPVISSTSTALPEVCGEAAIMVNPDDVDGWIDAIRMLRENLSEREKFRRRGLRRAEHFTWRNSARVYLSLMAEADR